MDGVAEGPAHADLSAIPLLTPTGAAASMEQFRGTWAVVQLVRYFGCLPCQEWLIALDRGSAAFAEIGVAVAAVGGSADYQARWLQREHGVGMPLLLDPEHQLRDALDMGVPLGMRLFDPRGLAAYARTLSRGFRPHTITRDTVRTPGVVILDPDVRPRWRFEGHRIGDYPSLDEVRAAAQDLVDAR